MDEQTIRWGDRFMQVFPPGGATLEVEGFLDDEHVAIRRPNGARQVFPVTTLLNERYWVRLAGKGRSDGR